jgi:hypothetical protein
VINKSGLGRKGLFGFLLQEELGFFYASCVLIRLGHLTPGEIVGTGLPHLWLVGPVPSKG